MWELDHKEGRALKNWRFRTVVLEKTLKSPLDCKEIKPVSPKGNQCWIFIGRTDVEAPILWSPDAKSQFIGKDLDAGKDGGQEEKGATEDEIVGWQHSMNMSLSKLRDRVKDREVWHEAVHGVAKSHKWLSDWKPVKPIFLMLFLLSCLYHLFFLISRPLKCGIFNSFIFNPLPILFQWLCKQNTESFGEEMNPNSMKRNILSRQT